MGKIKLKSDKEIKALREGGMILSDILKNIGMSVGPGVTGEEIDRKAKILAEKRGAVCSFYRFKGFPAHICLSLNNEVVHGIPFGKTISEGDLVSVDLGIKYKNLFTDSSITFTVPCRDKNSENSIGFRKKQKIARAAFLCLKKSLKYCRVGYRLGDIGFAIQDCAEKKGFSVVKKLVGHGVGYAVHEDPFIPNYGNRGQGERLRPGMVLAIEPMLNEGTDDVILDQKTGWAYRTTDGKFSAHFEWTVAITHKNPIILTPLDWLNELHPTF